MVAEWAYVRTDENGAMRVGNTRVSLDSVVFAFQQGEAPETIQRQFPSLSLEQVYGAITYYLAHRNEVDAYLRRQEESWERALAEQERNPPPAIRRLRALRSIPEFEAVSNPLLSGAARETAIERLLAEVPARLADGRLTPEQAEALQEWSQIRINRQRDARIESLQAHLQAQVASGDLSEEAKAAIRAACDALRRRAGARGSRAAEAAP